MHLITAALRFPRGISPSRGPRAGPPSGPPSSWCVPRDSSHHKPLPGTSKRGSWTIGGGGEASEGWEKGVETRVGSVLISTQTVDAFAYSPGVTPMQGRRAFCGGLAVLLGLLACPLTAFAQGM